MATAQYDLAVSLEQSSEFLRPSPYGLGQDSGTFARPKARIVIPCYNEEKRLPVERLQQHLALHPDIELLFVNDGSRDRTDEVLGSICRGAKQGARVVSLAQNKGKAEAVRLGVLEALGTGTSDYVGFWDADLATPLSAISQFVDVLDSKPHIEMVFGSRVRLLGRNIRRQPRRHYLGRVFATAVSTTLSLPIYDTQCGAKIFRVTPDLKKVFSRPFLSKWIFDVEIIARFTKLKSEGGCAIEDQIYEFPLESWEDVAGSKVSAQDFLVAASDLVKIRNRYL